MANKKSDIEKKQGIKNFLVPLSVLPSELELHKPGHITRLELVGTIVEIEGMRFLSTSQWKVDR
ncbi:MAG: hypothetical protein A4E53_02069 [Pelotomaculum sp. PtaB.Bin104]|nr:MAG: hypothetical protein A4E53_02069 [Pelotomaculum sp. PtaB.Bin104]